MVSPTVVNFFDNSLLALGFGYDYQWISLHVLVLRADL